MDRSQAFFMTAPSMTTPNAMYFHSATSSLRSQSDDGGLFAASPSATLLLNQSDSADCGWFWQPQAKQVRISVDLRCADFQLLETPCSWLTEPLCHGVGANPA